MNKLQKLTLVTISCAVVPAYANWFFPTKASLKDINQQTTELKQHISQDKVQQSQLQKELKKVELSIDTIARQLESTRNALAQEELALKDFAKKESSTKNQISGNQSALNTHLRAAYALGQKESWQVVLKQDDPEKVNRMLTYHQYVSKDRNDTITDLQTHLADLQKTQAEINKHELYLRKLISTQQQSQASLQQNYTDRKGVLAALNTRILTSQQKLQVLLAEQESLSKVVNNSAKEENKFTNGLSFEQLRGKLPWPTSGKILQHYGDNTQSGLKFSGLLIKAPSDQEVRAIYPGKVVFADWLKGYGLVVIIDHNHHFLSLYGQNRSIYKPVGSQVAAGEVIARVGQTGGKDNSGLYFEIRHEGKAINPERWLSLQ